MPLLRIRDLTVRFSTPRGPSRAVDGVSFDIESGGRFGLAGESGCGKSLTARAAMGLAPVGAEVGGSIVFDDAVDVSLGPARRRLRGREMGMVFQDPMTYLNPVFTVGEQIAESLRHHRGMNRSEARDEAVSLLAQVRIPEPERAARSYPWQLSGGMRQRALIAVAVAASPRLLIADEPTTALDLTVRAGILALINEWVAVRNMALWMISHDWSVIESACDVVAVMYAGRIVEQGSVREVVARPAHPYTRALMAARSAMDEGRVVDPIPGQVHPPTAHPPGCRFHPRCAEVFAPCSEREPAATQVSEGHWARCHRLTESEAFRP